MRELDLQTRIIKVIRNESGYARKWATQLQVGVPDLLIYLRPWGSLYAEVKLVKRKSFTAKIDTTQKQVIELERLHQAGAMTCLLVGIATPTVGRLYATMHWEKAIPSEMDWPYIEWNPRNIKLDMRDLIDRYHRRFIHESNR